jgi:hypothetical protein
LLHEDLGGDSASRTAFAVRLHYQNESRPEHGDVAAQVDTRAVEVDREEMTMTCRYEFAG